MKQSRFKNLTYQEKRKKLLTEIQKKCGGALTTNELEIIARNLAINTQCTLDLVHSSEQMQKELTLIWMTPPSSPAPNYIYTREYGKVLVGRAGFILIPQNWNRIQYPEEFTNRPSFSPNEKLVIKVEKHLISIASPSLQKSYRIILYLPA